MKSSQVVAALLFLAAPTTSLMSPPAAFCTSILRPCIQNTSRRRTHHLYFTPLNFIHTDNQLPWTPIHEASRSIPPPCSSKILPYRKNSLSLKSSSQDTENFREATHRGQGYITPRGKSDGLDDHGNRDASGSSGGGRREKRSYPFPKLSPGHQHDINAPPLKNDDALQRENRIKQMERNQLERGSRLNILAGAIQRKPLMTETKNKSKIVELSVGEEVCNALDARDKQHCIENFRDGRESAQFMKVIGKNNGAAKEVVVKSIGDSAVSSSEFQIDELLTEKEIKQGTSLRNAESFGKVDRFEKLRGPLSEGFRNGARMATYKQPEFGQVAKAVNGLNDDDDSDDDEQEVLDEDFDPSFDDLDIDDLDQDDELFDGGGVFQRDDDDEVEVGPEKLNVNGASGGPNKKSPSKLLSIDPTSIEILPLDEVKEDVEEDELRQSRIDNLRDPSSGSFVKMFRGSASYIANHRSTLAVYHVPGELLAWEGFAGLMDDIALTWLLGMKIVLVAGCRHQIDIRLEDEDDSEHHIGGKVMMSSIRVTDEDTLRVVKEEAGFVRFEIERRLAKSLRMHGGLVKGSENLVGNVVSGNFYSAQPFGVLDGIDYCSTGFPRKIEIERIRQVHESNDIVLLTSLGVSPSGEIFNVNSEFLAATAAGALGASKIIYFNVHGTSFQNKRTGKPVQNLRVSDAKNLLEHYQMRIHPKGFALVDLDEDSPHQAVLRAPGSMETLIKVGYSMVALEKGVKRAHILAPENGALVQELYTRDGCGTLISRDIYEGIRRADVNDVSGIYDLIEPLVQSGTLVERPKPQLEKEVLSYYVYTRDGLVVATGQLKRFEGGYAEIGCLVVSKDYRRGGRGDAMLGYLERMALQCGATKVFVLSTQTMEWFVERGFKEVPVASLPPSRQALYNTKRKSKIYMKEINGDRDLDAAELWWSNK